MSRGYARLFCLIAFISLVLCQYEQVGTPGNEVGFLEVETEVESKMEQKGENGAFFENKGESGVLFDDREFQGWQSSLIGCFLDDMERDLKFNPGNVNSIQACSNLCSSYLYFGLQYGGECRCGNRYATQEKYAQVKDSACGSYGRGAGNVNMIFSRAPDAHTVAERDQIPSFLYIGCFKDDANRDIKINVQRVNNGSPRQCIFNCRSYDLAAIQHNGECRCGNSFFTGSQYSRVADSECNVERGIGLGGGYRNAIYVTGRAYKQTALNRIATIENRIKEINSYISPVPRKFFIGCFHDDGNNRDFPYKSGSANAGIGACASTCLDYTYFAVQYRGADCWCGNSYGKFGEVAAAECGADLLGGSWRNAVFGFSEFSAISSRARSIKHSYIGCFKDDSSRDLKFQVADSPAPDNCVARCITAGYNFAGIQNGAQCWCGNNFGRFSQYSRVNDAECKVTDGLGTGGPWRNAIYATSPQAKITGDSIRNKLDELITHINNQIVPNLKDYFIGCFIDKGDNRDMATRFENIKDAGACGKACVGYNYFALQNGNECWCGTGNFGYGNQIGRYGEVSLNRCGNEREPTGGPYLNAIYAFDRTVVVEAKKSSVARLYIGCFLDDEMRDLRNKQVIDYAHVPSVCIAKCSSLGFKFASLQNGAECWCDNMFYRGVQYSQVSDIECKVDKGVGAGGGWRNAVYGVNADRQSEGIKRVNFFKDFFPRIANFHLGCFTDSWDRSFSTKFTPIKNLEECAGSCYGNKYFAMQAGGSECWCGNAHPEENKIPHGEVAVSSCGSKRTGGAWLNSVYVYSASDIALHNTKSISKQYIGCFNDADASNFSVRKDGAPSPLGCKVKCVGYKYFALSSQGVNCWCGNSFGLSDKYFQRSDARCNVEFGVGVGGDWANAVYANNVELANTIRKRLAAPEFGGRNLGFDFEYVGCYAENFNPSAHSKIKNVGHPEDCSRKCSGYSYFNLRDGGKECWCRNSAPTINPLTAETCGGIENSSKYVYGLKSNSAIYKNIKKTLNRTPNPKTYMKQFSPMENVNYLYLGCNSDDSNRDLPVLISGVSSVDDCHYECFGFQYFALQQNNCFCGHDSSTGPNYAPVNEEDCKLKKPFRNALYGRNSGYVMELRMAAILQ